MERTYWLTGHGDLLRLLHNTIRWVTRDERMVTRGRAGLYRDVLLGDRAGLCRAPAQLHQSRRPSTDGSIRLSARPADRDDEAAARRAGRIR